MRFIIIIIFIYLIYTIQKFIYSVNRQGDLESHRAYGRATSLTIINKRKKKCCECVTRPIQWLFKNKNSCIFVWKLRRFEFVNCLRFVRHKCVSIISGCSGIIVVNLAIRYKKPDWKAIGAISYFYNKTWIWRFQTYWLGKYLKFLVWRIKERNGFDSLSWW